MQTTATWQSHRILLFNTLAFMVCFASWVVNGVLVTFLVNTGTFSWSSIQIGWLLGVPILVGSVLRLPAGLLTDRIGGRLVMVFILLLSAIPMFLLSHANAFTDFLLLSLGFGTAGSSFAAGVAYTSLWYPKEMQGTAMGIFGVGNAGAALTAMFAPSLLNELTDNGSNIEGWRILPQLYAALLLSMAILFFFGTINRKPKSARSTLERLAPLRETRVWRFGLFYFFLFGSFVALSQWLIPYYVNVYAMSIVSAGLMATIFSLPAGVIRAVGGWLSDKVGARIVLQWVLGVCTVCLFFLFVPRMEIQAPGQGVMAGKSGTVTSVSSGNIGIDNDLYVLQSAEGDSSHVSIRFGIHQDRERFLLLPTASFHQEPVVDVGEEVVKGQLLAKGVTYVYFQANKWIFTTLIFVIGIMMGIGGAAVYKNIATYYPANVGTVGGIVGVLGGLGGFISPTIFGYLLKATGVWTTSWMFLALVSVVCMILHRPARNDKNERE